MSEPSSSVPDDIADAQVEESATEDTPSTVELDIDQDQVDAWDEIKADYQVDPDAESASSSTEGDDSGGDDPGTAEADDSPS